MGDWISGVGAEWSTYKNEFGPEGRAHQIIIPNTSPADWQLWLDYLAATDVEILYFVDGNPVSLPGDVREMCVRTGGCGRCMSSRGG